MSIPERILLWMICLAVMLLMTAIFDGETALFGAVVWLLYSNISEDVARRRAQREIRNIINRDHSGQPPDRDHMEM